MLRKLMRAMVVLGAFTLLLLTFGGQAQATPSGSPSPSVSADCGPVLTEKLQPCRTPNPCAITDNRSDLVRRLPCFEVKFTDKCDGKTIVSLGNTAPYTVAVYVVGDETYDVKGGTSKTITVTPHRGYVLVTAKGHEPWNHRYVKPVCPSPTPSATTSTQTVPGVPVNNGGGTSLPVTGPATVGIGIAGALLLIAGIAGVVIARKRKTSFTA